MVVKIHVVYCGAWGYRPKFERLKATLTDEFEGEIEMTGEGTPGATGYFEVEVDGTLVHSKKNGDGYVDDEAKLNKIKQAIEAKLKWHFWTEQKRRSRRLILTRSYDDDVYKRSPTSNVVWYFWSKGMIDSVWGGAGLYFAFMANTLFFL